MTSLGAGAGVFLCMTAAAGYIDLLHVTPAKMTIYVILAPLVAWGITYTLLERYSRKRGIHVKK